MQFRPSLLNPILIAIQLFKQMSPMSELDTRRRTTQLPVAVMDQNSHLYVEIRFHSACEVYVFQTMLGQVRLLDKYVPCYSRPRHKLTISEECPPELRG